PRESIPDAAGAPCGYGRPAVLRALLNESSAAGVVRTHTHRRDSVSPVRALQLRLDAGVAYLPVRRPAGAAVESSSVVVERRLRVLRRDLLSHRLENLAEQGCRARTLRRRHTVRSAMLLHARSVARTRRKRLCAAAGGDNAPHAGRRCDPVPLD